MPGGRFLVRMPPSLHEQASLAAASENVSLNPVHMRPGGDRGRMGAAPWRQPCALRRWTDRSETATLDYGELCGVMTRSVIGPHNASYFCRYRQRYRREKSWLRLRS